MVPWSCTRAEVGGKEDAPPMSPCRLRDDSVVAVAAVVLTLGFTALFTWLTVSQWAKTDASQQRQIPAAGRIRKARPRLPALRGPAPDRPGPPGDQGPAQPVAGLLGVLLVTAVLLVTVLMTNVGRTSPRPPDIALDFLSGSYADIRE